MAHRYVLAAAIPYFQSMFSSEMLESRQRKISIKVFVHFFSPKNFITAKKASENEELNNFYRTYRLWLSNIYWILHIQIKF